MDLRLGWTFTSQMDVDDLRGSARGKNQQKKPQMFSHQPQRNTQHGFIYTENILQTGILHF